MAVSMLVQIGKERSLELRIVRLTALIPHEHIIEALAESVTSDMERSRYQRDPLIIDGNTGLILDGMHRREALFRLGANFALCACFDYLSQEISVQRWLRYFIAPSRQMLDEVIDLFEFESVVDYDEAMRSVDSGISPIALLSKRHSYVSKAKYDIQAVYRRLGDFDKLAEGRKIGVDFHPEGEHDSMFASESVFVLYPLPFRKEDIIQIASMHKLFPYKTTRHIVPIRPMGVYFPLDLLKGEDPEKCDSELSKIISESKVDLINPGTWYEGRKYSEPLAIFKRSLNFAQPKVK